jgi:hypothetical protein
MRCREASELMSLYLDHRLAPDQVAELHDHLSVCPRCQREWEAMQRVSSLLLVLSSPGRTETVGAPMAAPPADFTVNVMDRLAQREARRRLFWGGMVLLLAALTLGAFALPTLVGPLSLLWPILAYPSLVGKGLLSLSQLIHVLRSLLEACWLVVTMLLSAIHPYILFVYFSMALLLTAFWLTVIFSQVRQGVPVNVQEG